MHEHYFFPRSGNDNSSKHSVKKITPVKRSNETLDNSDENLTPNAPRNRSDEMIREETYIEGMSPLTLNKEEFPDIPYVKAPDGSDSDSPCTTPRINNLKKMKDEVKLYVSLKKDEEEVEHCSFRP